MKDEFVDYETSKLLGLLGFDEKCLAHFNGGKDFLEPLDTDFVNFRDTPCLKAPLWQQIEKWLWEKYKAYIRIDVNEKDYGASLVSEDGNWDFVLFNDKIDSPMIAKNEGIKKSIEWLYTIKTKQYFQWQPKLKQ